MSKNKNRQVVIAPADFIEAAPAPVEEAVPVEKVERIADLMEVMEKASLRQIASLTGANYNSLLKASKAPIMGAIYDPDSINYPAVEAVLIRKIGEDAYLTLDWSEIDLESKSVVVDLTENEGDVVSLRGSQSKFTILLKTPTHVVLKPVDETNTQPRVMSNFTFKHSGGKVC